MRDLLSFEMMSENHIDSIMEIEAQSFRSPWSRASYVDELKNGHARYIVALENGEVVGYAGYWKIFDEAHVTTVAVGAQRRGRGFGRAIMEKLEELATVEGINAMTLEVRVSNAVARSLYMSLGFREAGVRPGYYTDTNEDAVIMWKWNLGSRGRQ